MARGVHVRVGRKRDIYFSPGYLGPPGPTTHGDLWATGLTAAGALVGLAKVWDAPPLETITCLAWTNLTHKLYVATQGADSLNHIYALSPGGTPTSVVGGYQYTPESFDPAAPTAMAEFGGKLYVSHVGGPSASGFGCYLTRFDPVGLTNTVVTSTDYALGQEIVPPFRGFWTGGVAVAGGVLYWCSGTRLWSSTDGASWSLFAALATEGDPVLAIIPGGYALSGLVTNPADGCCYVGGTYSLSGDPATPDNRRTIYRITAGGTLTQDFLAASEGDSTTQRNQIAGLTTRYDATDAAVGPFAVDRSLFGLSAPPLDVWHRAGSWGLDADVRGLVDSGSYGLHGKPFVSSKGHLLMLVSDQLSALATHLLRRDAVSGAWSVLHTFAGYELASDAANLGPMARVHTTIKCHEA